MMTPNHSKPRKQVRMISFNIPWVLLDMIDDYCRENKVQSRTQFLIEASQQALKRAESSGTAAVTQPIQN